MTTRAHDPKVRTAILAALVATSMVGVAYAAVPIYRLFCQVTGFGGTTQRAAGLTDAQMRAGTGHMVSVRFDGNVRKGLPWEFAPSGGPVTTSLGQQQLSHYRAKNLSDQPITGMAVFNVSPAMAGKYFTKIQCFCFNEQTLQPGQEVEMPIVWFVDPAILDDPDARHIKEITLSYSFYPVENPTTDAGIRATSGDQLSKR